MNFIEFITTLMGEFDNVLSQIISIFSNFLNTNWFKLIMFIILIGLIIRLIIYIIDLVLMILGYNPIIENDDPDIKNAKKHNGNVIE